MKFIITITIFFCLSALSRISYSQGIRDSVYHIREVSVRADRIFKKEEAGRKETRVDSLVVMSKINRSISDILAENTTVTIKDYGRGALATASFRGTSPTHTQVSWNGININSPMLGMVDFSLVPVFIVDDMSLQHGAASVSHNSGGLGGHISLNNKVDWNNTVSGRYYQGIGSYKSHDEFGQFNIGNKKVQSKTRLYHSYSKNDYKLINKHQIERDEEGEVYNPEQRNKNGQYSKYGIQQELYYKITPHLYSSVRIWYQDVERNIPEVLSNEAVDTIASRKNEQADNTLKGVVQLSHYHQKLQTKFTSGFDYQQLDYVVKIKNSGSQLNMPVNSGSKMKSWYNKLNMRYAFNPKLSSQLKLDVNYFDITSRDNANQTGYTEQRMEYSLFGAGYVNLTRYLNLSLELRKDFIADVESPLIYNMGISYKPMADNDLVLKANFARNFHSPTLNDLYWQPGGNPDLLPEKGYTGEVGLHYIKRIRKMDMETQLTGYYSDIDNWILWLPSVKGYWEAQNRKKVHAYGLEYNLKLGFVTNKVKYTLQATYGLTKSINVGQRLGSNDASIGSQLPFIPVHSGNMLLAVKYKSAYAHYQYHYYSVRNILSANEQVPENDFPFYRLYAQHLNHVTFGYQIKLGKSTSCGTELKVHNLFNEVYRSAINRIMPRRNYTLMLMFNF
ncbi:iron complex outermembrane recepter protein [Saccharicrinis carchari]|uniref:Iron complex outermembrane recepter protein n=1 Tax=Saccharicrinis carchari TaxID=1168039 RepID=A0A521AJU5_SACCC|nr:TonB-dependent receptor [Saccharicrinis carchari]SMO35038.1 iron complex outermembrane recepter protein [Saccharicrinis carchari]